MRSKHVLKWLIVGLSMCIGWVSIAQQAEARKLSFKRHIYPMFRTYCLKCHRPKTKRVWKKVKGKRIRTTIVVKKAKGDLDLRRKVAYKNIVDVQSKQAKEGYNIVTTGEVTLSYLVYKLNNQHKHPNLRGKGKQMPPKRKLSTWRIRRIMKWIAQGAKK